MEGEKFHEDAQKKGLALTSNYFNEDSDELLKKISEVVRDENNKPKTLDDISKSSEGDFLKKMEEIENEEQINNVKSEIQKTVENLETVVVGELIMNFDNVSNGKLINFGNINQKAKSLEEITTCNTKIASNEISVTQIENFDVKESQNDGSKNTEIVKGIAFLNKVKEDNEHIPKKKETEMKNVETVVNITSPNNVEPMSVDTSSNSNNYEEMDPNSETRNAIVKKSFIVDLEMGNVKKKIENHDQELDKCLTNVDKKTKSVKSLLQLESLQKEINKSANDSDKKKSFSEENCEIKENEKKKKIDIIRNKNEKLLNEEVQNFTTCKDKIEIINTTIESVLKNDNSITPVTISNVFYSTPIQKQFEISSENVSKVLEDEKSQIVNNSDENSEKTSSKIGYIASETETMSFNCTTSESENQNIDKFINICKNGMSDTSNEDEKIPDNLSPKSNLKFQIPTTSKAMINEWLESKIDNLYEVNFCSDENDTKYFLIEQTELKKPVVNALLEKSSSVSSDQSSFGSVTSLATLSLPIKSATNLSEISSNTSNGSQTNFLAPSQLTNNKIIKQQFKNKLDLCSFVIEHFTKIKNRINQSEQINQPISKKKLNTFISSSSSNSPNTNDKKLHRNSTQNEDEFSDVPKSKYLKKDETMRGSNDEQGEIVLAKWIDKKYYAGRILNDRPGNKYAVLFEDGASKTLLKEAIVFGKDGVLPLLNQSIYALVDEDDYEHGIVVSIDKSDNKVLYNVKTDKKTVVVNSTGIYLQEHQAKIIQKKSPVEEIKDLHLETTTNFTRTTRNKRFSASPVTHDAGYSGLAKTGNKRQKSRNVQPKNNPRKHSESTSEISDNLDDLTPPLITSVESTLEAIEGVQPEIQKTDLESEICKMIFLSDLKAVDSTIDVNNILGPLPLSSGIFKNKHFILSCTVDLKPHRYEELKSLGENFKIRQFSKIPFVKNYLKKQLEIGGGKVYDNFEDIPKFKYRQCKLISSRPCVTAKYMECIAADIQPISHEWIILCCKQNRLIDRNEYVLPAGWSITKSVFIKYNERETKKPLLKVHVLLASENKDFIKYWSRVCKLGGAEVFLIKSLNDVTSFSKGFMVADMDFPQIIKNKAEHFGIPIVSTVWIVETLILGKLCTTINHPKLLEIYQDEDF